MINLEFKTNRLAKIIFISQIVNHLTKLSMDKSCRIKSLRRQFFVKKQIKNQAQMRDNNKTIVLFVECLIVNVIHNTATTIGNRFIPMNSILITNGLITVGLYKKIIKIYKNKNKFKSRILKMMMINFKCWQRNGFNSNKRTCNKWLKGFL